MSEHQYDVFLSHNSKDKPAVKWLATKLEDEAKLNVFLDIWNLVPGDPWQEDLENALEASRTVAVFLGPAGISGWHNEELRNALTTRVGNRSRRVIPVLLPGTTMPEDDDIPSFLQRLTWVDFRNGLDDEEAFHCLVAGIRGEAPGRRGVPGKHMPPPKPTPKPTEKATGSTVVDWMF
ncbi:MAG: toll/interleukin-1 receptor domain-containing protein [Chloroflexi bacterium]|nr:toll/interleukin-1 receptor domain-containing protein [Chloroflexota bacterium]MBU1661596.1 toll/interleukin-1 receptor domain-containing protein [Chloroflexota bacterium]